MDELELTCAAVVSLSVLKGKWRSVTESCLSFHVDPFSLPAATGEGERLFDDDCSRARRLHSNSGIE